MSRRSSLPLVHLHPLLPLQVNTEHGFSILTGVNPPVSISGQLHVPDREQDLLPLSKVFNSFLSGRPTPLLAKVTHSSQPFFTCTPLPEMPCTPPPVSAPGAARRNNPNGGPYRNLSRRAIAPPRTDCSFPGPQLV
eukprot:scaffold19537_cov77-Isochrysis_galbana.AAC.2